MIGEKETGKVMVRVNHRNIVKANEGQVNI